MPRSFVTRGIPRPERHRFRPQLFTRTPKFSPYAGTYGIILSNQKHNRLWEERKYTRSCFHRCLLSAGSDIFVQWERGRALLVPIDAKLVTCHVIGAHRPWAWSKEGSQALAEATALNLLKHADFQSSLLPQDIATPSREPGVPKRELVSSLDPSHYRQVGMTDPGKCRAARTGRIS